jgi:hypothetical protein
MPTLHLTWMGRPCLGLASSRCRGLQWRLVNLVLKEPFAETTICSAQCAFVLSGSPSGIQERGICDGHGQ